MSAKSSHKEDQRCNECKFENLWSLCVCVLDDFRIVMSLKSSTGNKCLHHSKMFLKCQLIFKLYYVCTTMVAHSVHL